MNVVVRGKPLTPRHSLMFKSRFGPLLGRFRHTRPQVYRPGIGMLGIAAEFRCKLVVHRHGAVDSPFAVGGQNFRQLTTAEHVQLAAGHDLRSCDGRYWCCLRVRGPTPALFQRDKQSLRDDEARPRPRPAERAGSVILNDMPDFAAQGLTGEKT